MFKTMKNYNKIALACCSAAFGLFTLAGCEGGEIFEVDAPDWISDKVQEIEDGNKQEEEVLEGMMEDVYSFGNTDFSSGFWTAFSKYYVIPDGQKWNAVFNLNINPSAPNTYKNFALIICADADRDSEGYKEYGAIRFDNQPSGNSEWGDYIDRSYIQSTLTFETDTDAGIDKLGGKVTLTVDRTNPEAFNITMTNGTVTKTYKQPSALENLNSDASNTNIRCFIVPEGSYIDFLQTNIEPIGGCTSAADKNPESMVLQNVPTNVDAGTELTEAMAGVTAVVTFEEGVTKTVTASELSFSAIPDMDTAGEKTLVAAYNKTFKGENCDKPVMANAKFEVVESIKSIAVTTQPSHTTYYYYTTKATEALTDRTMAFDPTGMVVTATESTGKQRVLDNSRLTFSAIPATAGTHKVTITAGEGITAEVSITVQESQVSPVSYTGTVGATDNSTVFLQAYTDNFKVAVGETMFAKFKNYSDGAANWNNFLVVLRNKDNVELGVFRADNYAMRNGAEYTNALKSGGQSDWAAWLANMKNGGDVTVYVTNCGNSKADIQVIMVGTDSTNYYQYYLGIDEIEPDNLYFALSVEKAHLVFE